MKFTYCPDCGSELTERMIGDEGLVPFCEVCSRPWFPFSYSCAIALVKTGEFCLSGEVDQAEWFSYKAAMASLREGSIARRLGKAGYARVRDRL